ncbi:MULTISPECIES: hypothetical protein [unclassified Streptomyces]|uniref:hypothetical protein n=1 Tax=unclassified Streptomyces TaxID=2593676 RepID=UPI0016612057|nr:MULTISPECIES: hypothetical protein [unclassified Streptomyces]MBD0707716.1 hypothetical protein [Streptomyces sp. CBMA291]MBD0714949.1 hypothetical protein [Streptomyces sp. CBMA370]
MEAGPRDREQHGAAVGDPTEGVPGARTDAQGPTSGLAADAPGLSPDGPDDVLGTAVEVDADEVEVELRPQRRLRIWQLAPIVGLAALGSLMFAFPLAFGSGDGGAVVAMLGLLISSCAAGWGVMAARKVGYTWPGLPRRGSGERPNWRVLFLYAVTITVLVALAVWRVARLR